MAQTNPEVEAWFKERDHPQTALMQRVRALILEADPRVEECVKWKTPTFVYKGNIASINPQARNSVSLMFHTGAQIPGSYEHLYGSGQVARYIRFDGADDVEAKAGELQAVVRAWCEMKGG